MGTVLVRTVILIDLSEGCAPDDLVGKNKLIICKGYGKTPPGNLFPKSSKTPSINSYNVLGKLNIIFYA